MQMTVERLDTKTWRAGFLLFKDMGRVKDGVTRRYEVTNAEGIALGWFVWKNEWRRYTYKPVTGWDTWYDASCLTSLATFASMVTDERKAHWGAQGRFANRQ